MDLEVHFCPLIARLQGYIIRYLDDSGATYNKCLVESLDEFVMYMDVCIRENGSPSHTRSLHHLLLTCSGLAEANTDSDGTQSTMAMLGGAPLPPEVYLATVATHLRCELLQLAGEADGQSVGRLCDALVAAVGRAQPGCWRAAPCVMETCLTVVGRTAGGTAADVAAAATGRLVTCVEDALTGEPPAAAPALALAECLLLLLRHEPAAATAESEAVAVARAAAVRAALALFRRVTLNTWLDWAEVDSAPGAPSVQARVARALRDVARLVEEVRAEEAGADQLPADTDQLIVTCRPFAGQERLSRAERCAELAAGTGTVRHRRHLTRQLVAELSLLEAAGDAQPDDASDEDVVRCIADHRHLVPALSLRTMVDLVRESAAPGVRESPLKDAVIEIITSELVRNSSEEEHRLVAEHMLKSAPDVRCSSWDQDLRTTLAKVTLADATEGSTHIQQLAALLLQSPAQLLQELVDRTVESRGKAALVAAVVPRLADLVPLTRPQTPTNGLLGSTVLDRMEGTAVLDEYQLLVALLMTAIRGGLAVADAAMVQRVVGQTHRKRLTLLLIKGLLSEKRVKPRLCGPLALYCIQAMDESLDLCSAAQDMVEQRHQSYCCLKLLREVTLDDTDGALASLSARCHPLTQLYVGRWLLDTPPPDEVRLLHCLAGGTTLHWPVGDYTLLKATLASYLPYLCTAEWETVRLQLLQYHADHDSPSASAVTRGDRRPTARVAWYYSDLLTLWTTAAAVVADDESLVLTSSQLTVVVRTVVPLVKECLDAVVGDLERADDLAATFLAVTHMMTLVTDRMHMEPLERLAIGIVGTFIEEMTARMKDADMPEPVPDSGPLPRAELQLDQMDANANVLSQFVVGCFNIPNGSQVKQLALQMVSRSMLSSLVTVSPAD